MALTRTSTQSEEVPLALPAATAYEALLAAFAGVGKIQSEEAMFRRVTGRIYSGSARMNPASVTASVEASGEESRLKITATAQEGLIPQNTAARAVSRLLQELSKVATQSR